MQSTMNLSDCQPFSHVDDSLKIQYDKTIYEITDCQVKRLALYLTVIYIQLASGAKLAPFHGGGGGGGMGKMPRRNLTAPIH